VSTQPKRIDFWADVKPGGGAERRKELRRTMQQHVVEPLIEDMKKARWSAARARLFPVR
jgi:hypothetical protein